MECVGIHKSNTIGRVLSKLYKIDSNASANSVMIVLLDRGQMRCKIQTILAPSLKRN